MDTFFVEGRRARVFRAGDGPRVVYLHSGFGEVGAIEFLTELASTGCAVIAPELPGFGLSEPFPEWKKIEDVVFYLREMLDALEVDRAVIAGSSLGGWLAAELAVWAPERVDGLALISPVGLHIEAAPIFEMFGSETPDLLEAVFPSGGNVLEHLGPAIEDSDDPDATILHFLNALAAVARIGWNPYLHDPNLLGRLRVIRVPALVLWGSLDGVLPRAHVDAYASGIHGAQLEILDGLGHLPALESAAETAHRISAFVRDIKNG